MIKPDPEELSRIKNAKSEALDKVIRPSFYAILPANIRYDGKLSYLEKILYAEISALCGSAGYCYATNEYFSTHYSNSVRTISRAITNLSKRGFIYTFYERNGLAVNRKIYLNNPDSKPDKDKEGVLDKNVYPRQKCLDNNIAILPYDNIEDIANMDIWQYSNNNKDNITKNNTVSIIPQDVPTASSSKEDSPTLPSWLGKTSHARLGKLYSLLWQSEFNTPLVVKMGGTFGAICKRLLAEHSEQMVGLMFFVHFEWRGVSGKTDAMHKRLRDAGFPITWIPTSANAYSLFIKDTLKVTNPDETATAVINAIAELKKKLNITDTCDQ